MLADCQRPSPVSTSHLINGSSFKESESIQKALHPNELSKPTSTTSSRIESQIGGQRSSHPATSEVEIHHPEPLGPQDLGPTGKQYRFTFQRTAETQQAQERLISTLDSSIIGCKRKCFIALPFQRTRLDVSSYTSKPACVLSKAVQRSCRPREAAQPHRCKMCGII